MPGELFLEKAVVEEPQLVDLSLRSTTIVCRDLLGAGIEPQVVRSVVDTDPVERRWRKPDDLVDLVVVQGLLQPRVATWPLLLIVGALSRQGILHRPILQEFESTLVEARR